MAAPCRRLPRPSSRSSTPAVVLTKQDLALPSAGGLFRCLPFSAPANMPLSAPASRSVGPPQGAGSKPPRPGLQRRARSASSRRSELHLMAPCEPGAASAALGAGGKGLPASSAAASGGGGKPRVICALQISGNRGSGGGAAAWQAAELEQQSPRRGVKGSSPLRRAPGGPGAAGLPPSGPPGMRPQGLGKPASIQRVDVGAFPGPPALHMACMPKIAAAEVPKPAALAAEEPSVPGHVREQVHFGAPPRASSLQGLLQVSGSAAPVALQPAAPSGTPPPQDLQELLGRGWESSDGEEGDAAAVLSEGEEAFHYSRYRYCDAAAARAAGCPPPAERHRRGRSQPLRGAPGDAGCAGGEASEESCASPWRRCSSPWAPGGRPPARTACSTPVCEEEGQREEEEELRRLAEALVKFYGLSGGASRATRLRPNVANLVLVDERAWAERQRRGQLDEPPMMWIRGGRVYDFHGDRGTLEEFEHDMLVRQVEDDPGIRDRRREQGLMPFPFVAVPLKGHWDPEAEEEKPPPRGEAPRADRAEAARRRHWLSA
ncbi:unnamed protein product [Prorocentrum cordatum]|uniref:Uncharacterized protein n=1 Tax=Prorocentrum cordatum TaxID=2364126 RepID=A0ABN9UJJ3_9DINO|nr:unnamed protein product [Polarella glacialis]